MIKTSKELEKMLDNTLGITRGMVANGITTSYKDYYEDVYELLRHFSCVLQTVNHADCIELKTNKEIEDELGEYEDHVVITTI